MYPPEVPDQTIRTVIRELTQDSRLPSGAHLRRILKQRFQHPGGVRRIYRLLAAEQPRKGMVKRTAEEPPTSAELLARLEARVELAEEREEAHQRMWALQIDELRMRVAELEPLAEKGRAAHSVEQRLRDQLRAAYARITQLEDQVLRQSPSR